MVHRRTRCRRYSSLLAQRASARAARVEEMSANIPLEWRNCAGSAFCEMRSAIRQHSSIG